MNSKEASTEVREDVDYRTLKNDYSWDKIKDRGERIKRFKRWKHWAITIKKKDMAVIRYLHASRRTAMQYLIGFLDI